ncbi:hypothetical protein EMIT0180MI3_80018 [Priestia megaterium]
MFHLTTLMRDMSYQTIYEFSYVNHTKKGFFDFLSNFIR